MRNTHNVKKPAQTLRGLFFSHTSRLCLTNRYRLIHPGGTPFVNLISRADSLNWVGLQMPVHNSQQRVSGARLLRFPRKCGCSYGEWRIGTRLKVGFKRGPKRLLKVSSQLFVACPTPNGGRQLSNS
jgi:hypothetical protein